MKRILSLVLTWVICLSLVASLNVTATAATIKNETYYIWSKLDSTKVIDIDNAGTENGTNVQLYGYNGTNAQKFKITRVNGDYYKITAVCSKKVLDVAGGSKKSGTNVQQYKWNNSDAQKWKFIDAGDGYYYIKSALGTYLDVSGGKANDGTNIQAYKGNQSDAQKWRLLPADATYTTKTVTIKANSLEEWSEKTKEAEQSMTGAGSGYVDSNNKFVYTGKVIVDRAILSYQTIETQIPIIRQGPNMKPTYKTVKVKLPYKMKYTLHQCDIKTNATSETKGAFVAGLAAWKIVMTQECACGYRNRMEMELPEPAETVKTYTAHTIRTYEKVY